MPNLCNYLSKKNFRLLC